MYLFSEDCRAHHQMTVQKHFKAYSFPFLCNLLWESGNNTKRCVSLTTSNHWHNLKRSQWNCEFLSLKKEHHKSLSSGFREDLRLFARANGSDNQKKPTESVSFTSCQWTKYLATQDSAKPTFGTITWWQCLRLQVLIHSAYISIEVLAIPCLGMWSVFSVDPKKIII